MADITRNNGEWDVDIGPDENISLATAGTYIDGDINIKSSKQYAYAITEDIVTVTKDTTKGVSPYSTSYGYTNIEIKKDSGIKWVEGALYTFCVNTKMVVSSTYRNVRVRIGGENDGDSWHPLMGTSSIIAGSTYLVKAYNTIFQYKSVYQTGGALHLQTDKNTNTYVTQAYSTTDNTYPILSSATAGITSTSSREATTAILNNQIYANPNKGRIHSKEYALENNVLISADTFSPNQAYTDSSYTVINANTQKFFIGNDIDNYKSSGESPQQLVISSTNGARIRSTEGNILLDPQGGLKTVFFGQGDGSLLYATSDCMYIKPYDGIIGICKNGGGGGINIYGDSSSTVPTTSIEEDSNRSLIITNAADGRILLKRRDKNGFMVYYEDTDGYMRSLVYRNNSDNNTIFNYINHSSTDGQNITTGSTNIYGGGAQIVNLGSSVEKTSLKHNGYEIGERLTATKTGAQAMATGAWTNITLSGSTLSLPPGVWIVTGSLTFVSKAAGNRRGVRIAVDGTGYNASATVLAGGCAGSLMVNTSYTIATTTNRTVSLQGFQDTGANLNTDSIYLTAVRIAGPPKS